MDLLAGYPTITFFPIREFSPITVDPKIMFSPSKRPLTCALDETKIILVSLINPNETYPLLQSSEL